MGDFRPAASMVADSISPDGVRLSTMVVALHRFMLPELNTHRAFSRNSGSHRAIPMRRTLDKVRLAPAVPLAWRTEQAGMQGGPPLGGVDAIAARTVWLRARDAAAQAADELARMGVHKSIANRLIEPFLGHTAVITATDFDGFFDQRATPTDGSEPLAQDEIRAAADLMRDAYTASTPTAVPYGGWHLPFVDEADRMTADLDLLLMMSAARCARVSYLNHHGVRDPESDQRLYRRLVNAKPPHASPLEHVATPAPGGQPVPGNLRGWHQLRHRVWP